MKHLLALALLLALAACGGSRANAPGAAIAVPQRANFGDADPFDWPGRHPGRYDVHGIDVSRWQGGIDWTTARANGVTFAFIKATEGGDRKDPGFEGHWSGAGAAGVARGAYHFFYFCTPAAVQARWFIANVPRTPGALPPVLDLEWNHLSPTCTLRPPPEVVRREAKIFLDIVGQHFGQAPVIYTTPDFWTRNGIAQLGAETWLRAVAGHPDQVYPGAAWTFWQYSATGLVPGVRGKVDVNAFRGSPAEWSGWYGARQHR